ncbi:nucleolar MIF4G domain-containing protein 1 homolog [Apis mellifera]|uniref:Nucleolar MIF4G domain-containing protein 1 homolog n=1 Tax=Apis mellifera TaxID=7460 RepID=A0A7M7H7A9_APIME|nr:nucleolar MIF4G domain-containing protein 1 homolog [Apis mellifera]|eukprot:XP_006571844.1 nucleolar MIF4G domain-containing protein 1 homolog [Apis mellifera]
MKLSKQSKLNTKKMELKLTEKSRKQMRKELRKQKKINKSIYFKNKRELYVDISNVNDNKTNHNKIINKEINRLENSKKCTKNNFEKIYHSVISMTNCSEQVKIKKSEEFEYKKKKQKCKLLKEANLKEDKEIRKLEKKLKLTKRKKKTIPKSFVTDGLDYLLDFCLQKNKKYITETKEEILEDEFSNQFNINSLEIEKNIYTSSALDNIKENKNENIKSEMSKNYTLNLKQSNNNSSDKVLNTQTKKIDSIDYSINDENFWEDIYGRKRNKEGDVIYANNANKYVPPAIRATNINSNEDEKLHFLRKQLKGCLNKVAEHNMYNIVNQIEALYMTNSRNNMNNILSELVLESLISHVITPDRLICEHMMLIAILHANIGIEVGANFLEKLIKKFIKNMEKFQSIENKELDNIVLIISHLYNFKIFGYKLLYEILNKLMIKFTEKEIELILLILKTVGFSLRRDDPNALKEFIQSLQQKAVHESEKNSRVKFMLDILLAIKNNNINKIPQYDPSHVQHLRKVIKNIIRKGNTITQFNVSLEDLLHVDEKGKWWIIGSAWSGSNNISDKTNLKEHNNLNFNIQILKLAQKQRMNTDIRKNIFCILMTAEDYLDAFEKLHHLDLKNQQETEIIHVLIHCCLQENKFNPYYAILAQKLCEYNRKYQLTIQCNFWDKLKTLEAYNNKQLINLTQFLIHLLIEKCLALSILKVIEFTELKKHTITFLKQIILGILLHENEQASIQVFERISVSSQLQTFRESLRLFINCFLVKNIDMCTILDKQKIILKKRVEIVDKILILHGSKLMF